MKRAFILIMISVLSTTIGAQNRFADLEDGYWQIINNKGYAVSNLDERKNEAGLYLEQLNEQAEFRVVKI